RLVLKREIPVRKVLSALLPQILQQIAFPKTMRWDGTGTRFARPVRWLVALYGPQVVPGTFGTLKAGRQTYPNRRLGDKPVTVKNTSSYFSLLSKLGVQLEQGASFRRENNEPDKLNCPKKEALRRKLETMARKLGGRLPDENTEEFEWLINVATFLAEDPVVADGSFLPEYLDLPPEVLATSMAKHLKLFSIRARDSDELLPRFLAVLEGQPGKPATVIANVERILEARFTDARFFWKEDTSMRLETKVSQLEKVVFHEKLGSVAERIPRLEKLMDSIVDHVGLQADVLIGLKDAAKLCKADLVTQMVREFPSLQGIIGAHYAKEEGELDIVTGPIREHYRPRTAADPVPQTVLGAVLSLADRVDMLTGYFGAGFQPTGSADPYGLRRQALGFVRILLSPPQGVSFVGLSIDRLFDRSIQSWGSRIAIDPVTLKKELRVFLRERFEWLVARQEPDDRELVAAVLVAGDDDLAGAQERLKILRGLWADSSAGRRSVLERAAKVAERTARMVKAAKEEDGLGSVDQNLFQEAAEKKLWEAWNRISPVVQEEIQHRRWARAVEAYSALYPEVHAFFEKVFVMGKDPSLRRNRLAFIHEIHRSLAEGFADLSKLPLSGME
ncbi:MAG: glycine--tRNA ligase subunit beta, partial [Candidatus Omnitrophica bacterium]|nr:glycine--tRNA ligase subunit beta [Candidatus Omnitrophota bacterium]